MLYAIVILAVSFGMTDLTILLNNFLLCFNFLISCWGARTSREDIVISIFSTFCKELVALINDVFAQSRLVKLKCKMPDHVGDLSTNIVTKIIENLMYVAREMSKVTFFQNTPRICFDSIFKNNFQSVSKRSDLFFLWACYSQPQFLPVIIQWIGCLPRRAISLTNRQKSFETVIAINNNILLQTFPRGYMRSTRASNIRIRDTMQVCAIRN